jgi:hypothetical protein
MKTMLPRSASQPWFARLSAFAVLLALFTAEMPVWAQPGPAGSSTTNKASPVGAPVGYRRSCDPAAFDQDTESLGGATVARQIEYSYCLVLDRRADWAGAHEHAKLLKAGRELVDILAGMLNSEEFRRKHSTADIDDRQFITLLYRLLIAREPDEVGLAGYLAQLEAKTLSRADVGRAILASAEFQAMHQLLFARGRSAARPPPTGSTRHCDLGAFNLADSSLTNAVGYAYCLVLDRPADEAGAREHVRSIERGETLTDILVAMLNSHEFANTHGISRLDDSEYIALHYRLLVGRVPDGAGMASYLRQLESKSLTRADLGKVIIGSGEFQAKHALLFTKINTLAVAPVDLTRSCVLGAFEKSDYNPDSIVAYAYCLILGRAVSNAEAREHADAMSGGRTPTDILLGLLNSDEFADAHAIAGLDDGRYIALLYRVLVKREPDGGGLSSYLAQLEGKTLTRTDLGRIIIGSSEFRMRHPFLFEPPRHARFRK